MLQNKKYIKFADENTVEVLALSRLDEGIEKGDKKAATYETKDGQTFLFEWPNLTVEDVKGLSGSKAGTYNQTGRIPYTAVVDPHTLAEMGNIAGGYGMGTLIDLVKEKKKELEKQHGKSVSRKELAKVRKEEESIREDVSEGKLTNALAACAKLEKSVAKTPALVEMAGKIRADVLEACSRKLEELEAEIGRGEAKAAARELGPLARALKGTPLEERAEELLEKTKSA